MRDTRPWLMPIVLVGGRSTRFGRDKLSEPLPNGDRMIDRPIRALRDALHAPVTLVGNCAPEVRSRGDAMLDDGYPGVGPLGGILHALQVLRCDVFVLAGDLPFIEPGDIRQIADAALLMSEARVIRARGQPCIGIYRFSLVERLGARLRSGDLSLMSVAYGRELGELDVPLRNVRNVNTPDALNELMEDA